MNRSEPFLLINFKTYLEATGKRALDLSRKIEQVARNNGVQAGVTPQFCDIEQVATHVQIPVFAQHIDPITSGANTGHVLAEAVRAAGASGTLINHSERMLRLFDIEKSVQRASSPDYQPLCAQEAQHWRQPSHYSNRTG